MSAKKLLSSFLVFSLLFSSLPLSLFNSVSALQDASVQEREIRSDTSSRIDDKSGGNSDTVAQQYTFDDYANYEEGSKDRDEYVNDEVVIKYRKEQLDLSSINSKAKKDNFITSHKLKSKTSFDTLNIDVLKITDGKSVTDKIAELKADPIIEYAEPNFIYHNLTSDPYYNYEWFLHNTGQYVYDATGLADADIDAPEAWNVFARNENSNVVAVIDSGVSYNHPDLLNNMWNGSACLNEYGNYLGGCIYGYDFISNDRDPYPLTDEYHGTHVAGIIASQANNYVGISGVNSNVKIMAIRAGGNDGYPWDTVAKAINFTMYNDVKIINLSLGGTSYSQALYDSIASFRLAGGLVVVAAGNNTSNNDIIPMYPASYNLDNIISVAATDQSDVLASFSNYGATSVDVAAPGTNILSTIGWTSTFYENFQSATVPYPPYAWTFTGLSVTAGTTNKYAIGDYYSYPYSSYADYSMISPLVNLSGFNGATISFDTLCDTEFTTFEWYDYMTVEISKDNAFSFQEIDLIPGGAVSGKYDEAELYYLGGEAIYDGYSYYFSNITIPSDYLSSSFRLRFRWRTDGSYNNYLGCLVDDVMVTQATNASNYIENYAYLNGTSMATPVVAGVASLVWGYRPTLSYSAVKTAILNSGDTKASLIGKMVSGKRVNAYNALKYVQGDVVDTFTLATRSCSISEKNTSVNCSLQADTVKTNLAPTITLTGGSINPASGVARDFSQPLSYTYTKGDMSSEIYDVLISNYLSTYTFFRSGQYGWSIDNTKYVTTGDYNGDGKDEVAAMYDYGNQDMALIIFSGNGTSFATSTWFRSGQWNWGVANTKYITSGDFDNDGVDEIAAMYDYGNQDMALIVFNPVGNTFTTSTWFRSGPYNWGIAYTKYVTAGDFNNDGKDELSAMYDYGNQDMALIVFNAVGNTFTTSTWFRSGTWNWGVANTKYVTAGDFNNDGEDELSAMYDYGNEDMALIVFSGNGTFFAPFTWFRSGIGNWGIAYTKYVTAGDFDNDGIDEISAMYDYGNQDMSMIVFNGNGSSFYPTSWFRSGIWNWGVASTKYVTSGDFNGNGITELSSMYDYGYQDMALIVFK